MAKLIALALAFTALVAFASAHTTVITTTIEDENPISRQQCSQQIQGQRLNQCQRYLQQDQSWIEKIIPGQMQGGLQSCCQELQNVDDQCQCEAVKEAFRQAQRMQQQQQQGSQQIKQMKQKAENLPNQCKLQTRQCQVGTISVVTTTTIAADEHRSGSQMCQNIRGRRFNQCQSYVQKQSGSYGTLLMSVNRKGEQMTQGLQQCCSELENVEEECQCEAMKEVYRQATQQMQKQGRQQGGRQTQTQTQEELQQIVENLRNQCDLQVQQCRIPSVMF